MNNTFLQKIMNPFHKFSSFQTCFAMSRGNIFWTINSSNFLNFRCDWITVRRNSFGIKGRSINCCNTIPRFWSLQVGWSIQFWVANVESFRISIFSFFGSSSKWSWTKRSVTVMGFEFVGDGDKIESIANLVWFGFIVIMSGNKLITSA